MSWKIEKLVLSTATSFIKTCFYDWRHETCRRILDQQSFIGDPRSYEEVPFFGKGVWKSTDFLFRCGWFYNREQQFDVFEETVLPIVKFLYICGHWKNYRFFSSTAMSSNHILICRKCKPLFERTWRKGVLESVSGRTAEGTQHREQSHEKPDSTLIILILTDIKSILSLRRVYTSTDDNHCKRLQATDSKLLYGIFLNWWASWVISDSSSCYLTEWWTLKTLVNRCMQEFMSSRSKMWLTLSFATPKFWHVKHCEFVVAGKLLFTTR